MGWWRSGGGGSTTVHVAALCFVEDSYYISTIDNLSLKAQTEGEPTSISCFPTSQCRGSCFPTPFCEIFLVYRAKFECLPVHIHPRPLPKAQTCFPFVSLMSGHPLNTSSIWGSGLFLLDECQGSTWTSSLGIDRSSNRIFIASFTMVVNTRNITVTFLSFSSWLQSKYGNPKSCQLLGFGCAKLDYFPLTCSRM